MVSLIPAYPALACPACERQQPALLRSLSHGTGPASDWEYPIIGIMAAIVIWAFYRSLKMLIRPGEKADEHIKHKILKFENDNEK